MLVEYIGITHEEYHASGSDRERGILIFKVERPFAGWICSLDLLIQSVLLFL